MAFVGAGGAMDSIRGGARFEARDLAEAGAGFLELDAPDLAFELCATSLQLAPSALARSIQLRARDRVARSLASSGNPPLTHAWPEVESKRATPREQG